jgi:hypothetical protein
MHQAPFCALAGFSMQTTAARTARRNIESFMARPSNRACHASGGVVFKVASGKNGTMLVPEQAEQVPVYALLPIKRTI